MAERSDEGLGIATLFGTLFLAGGGLLAAGGWGAWDRDSRLLAEGRRTQAVVVALDDIRDVLGDSSHLVRYRFNTPDGRVIEKQRHLRAADWKALRVGAPLEVVYDAADPAQGFPLPGGGVGSPAAAWLALGAGGTLAAGGGALLVVVAHRLFRRVRQRSAGPGAGAG